MTNNAITWPDLNVLWMREFRPLYQRLDMPLVEELAGTHHGQVVGPRWLRTAAPALLTLLGMGGWCGKRFESDGRGLNLVQRNGREQEIMPMRVQIRPSLVDAKPTVVITYPAETSPFPWPRIIDEVRRLDETRLLGLTIVQQRGLRRFSVPFLLEKQAD